MGWHYLVRVQRTTRLQLEGGRELSFEEYAQTVGLEANQQVHAFKKAEWMPCWAATYWEPGHEETWMLLTNLPQVHGKSYALRMWQELAFRDFKSGGFQWQKSRLQDPERANLLWLVMALAYAWILSLGTQVTPCACFQSMTNSSKLSGGSPFCWHSSTATV